MENNEQVAAPVAETVAEHIAENQGIQQANTAALEKTDSFEAGIQQPVKMEGVADKTEKVYGEKVNPAAPVAAPITQIAPVSANGEQTSSRESMKNDAPLNVQVTQPSGEDLNPSAPEANPSSIQPEVAINEEEAAPAFEDLPPLEQANVLLGQIPGRFRLY